MSYAKLLNEMWNLNQHVVAPTSFKKILGEYNPTFNGYGQQDSHECINTVLDLLGEDLYRKGKKPSVEMNVEDKNQKEEEQAKEAWHKHLLRNESIITDLFHGQFKSTVNCNKCDRVSVTFDPMMTILLPIPTPKKKVEMFFLPYNITKDYINKSFEVSMRDSESIGSMREEIEKEYDIPKGTYAATMVYN